MSDHTKSLPNSDVSELYVYGASGHGKVVAEIALAAGHIVLGFIDDDSLLARKCVLGLPVVGGFEWLAKRAKEFKIAVALGVGDNRARDRVAKRCAELEISLLSLVHPSAIVSPSASLGDGTVVMPHVVVNADAKIGEGAILNTGAIVEHDCIVGDYAHLSPNSAMGGASSLGGMSWLGMNAAIIQGISVGAYSIVGAGAVVIQCLPDAVTAVGVPARVCQSASYKK
jgi:sugar O-acyltransferase (sialic acid O-acetyltransferase NeuD family)